MRQVAKVNGVSVYSNKEIKRIVNGRIKFTDGSWCDVSARTVVNKGGGYITLKKNGQILKEGEEEEQSSFGPQAYQTSTLNIKDVEADVEIQPCDGPQMIVSINGAKSGVENIQVIHQESQLILCPKNNAEIGGVSPRLHTGNMWEFIKMLIMVLVSFFRPSNKSVIIQTENGIVITQVSNQPQAEVRIHIGVPQGSNVQLSNICGEVKVGDTDGPFSGTLKGSWEMTVGKVGDAKLSTSGSGEIKVQEVNGDLSIDIEKSGNIQVTQGNVGVLTAKTNGYGNISFGGTAKSATLTTLHSGNIKVKRVEEYPLLKKGGYGNITVGNW